MQFDELTTRDITQSVTTNRYSTTTHTTFDSTTTPTTILETTSQDTQINMTTTQTTTKPSTTHSSPTLDIVQTIATTNSLHLTTTNQLSANSEPVTTKITSSSTSEHVTTVSTTVKPTSMTKREPSTAQSNTTVQSSKTQMTLQTIKPSLIPASRAHQINCCCRCPSNTSSTYQFCSGPDVNQALACTSGIILQNTTPTPMPTSTYVRSEKSNLVAPSPLVGSVFPARLTPTQSFQESETFTETLAALPESAKANLGYSMSDLILTCQFNGIPCNMIR